LILKKTKLIYSLKDFPITKIIKGFLCLFVIILVLISISFDNDISKYLRGFNGVIFSKKSGVYNNDIIVNLRTINPFTKIYFTLDGSEPNLNSIQYVNPISISKNTVVRAKSYVNNNTFSQTFTNSYFFSEDNSIPIVSISINQKDLTDKDFGILGLNFSNRGDEWQKPIHLEIIENESKNYFKQDLTIRVFGGSSRQLPQKSFRICADNKVGLNLINYTLFSDGNKRHKCFLLRNFGNDWGHSLIRDVLLQKNSESTKINFQRHKFVNVFINGEYYSLASMQEYHDAFYFSEKYGGDIQDYEILENKNDKSGKPEVVNGDKKIEYEIVSLIKKVGDEDIPANVKYNLISEKFDIDNYIDYYLLNTYYGNIDWITSNVRYFRYNPDLSTKDSKFLKEKDGKWRFFLQDLDSSFGLATEERGYSDRDDNMIKRASETVFQNNTKINLVFRELLKNDSFRLKFFNRYKELRATIFTPEHIIKYIDEYEKTLTPHIERYNEKWQGTEMYNNKIFDNNYEKWKIKIEELRKYSKERPANYDKDIKEVLGIEYEL